MTKNKNHWYDGWFYDKLIAPNQDQLFGQIKNLVDSDSIIIDVGCGTGRLAFGLADKCKSVLGIIYQKGTLTERISHYIRILAVRFLFRTAT
jgi:ubiquinone/menaquinone biosynthesis C-methylase UbiE